MRVALGLALAFAAMADDRIKGNQIFKSNIVQVDPKTIRIGESACIGGAGSYEHHVWAYPRGGFFRSPGCTNVVTRTKSGWKIKVSIPIAEIDSDATFQWLGYIRMTEVE